MAQCLQQAAPRLLQQTATVVIGTHYGAPPNSSSARWLAPRPSCDAVRNMHSKADNCAETIARGNLAPCCSKIPDAWVVV